MSGWLWLSTLASAPERLSDFARARHYRARLRHVGERVRLGHGLRIEYPEFVEVGSDVHLNEQCWISMLPPGAGDAPPLLSIGSGTYIGRFATLACMRRVEIGARVLISDRVFVGDSLHGFRSLERPIADQPMVSPGPVHIGEGTWIGIGACILPNVTVGRNCVVGANAVVTADVPDYHVVVGVPARVVRRIEPHDPPAGRHP